MSGLLAQISLDGRALGPGAPETLLDAIAHRGDRPGELWTEAGIALGHVSLATTAEAERERLPASDRSGRYRFTWDGRLDNRQELEAELRIARGSAQPPTDADYALAAYVRWAEGCVDRLLGDWALVVWDAEARRLFCAKDPLGWRPLFYLEQDGLLTIGSEPLQLFRGVDRSPEPDHDYVLRFLADAVQEPGTTYYEGVRELEGGEYLVAAGGAVTVRRYWTGPRANDRGYRRLEDCVDDFAAVFRDAVRDRPARERSGRGRAEWRARLVVPHGRGGRDRRRRPIGPRSMRRAPRWTSAVTPRRSCAPSESSSSRSM